MSVHRESLSSVKPDQQRITCNNKREKTSDILITGGDIQEPVNQSKGAKKDTITDVEKNKYKMKKSIVSKLGRLER